MTKQKKAPESVIRWLTLTTIMVALAIAAKGQASDGLSKFAGSHASPAPEGTGKVALIRESEHERDLGLRVVV